MNKKINVEDMKDIPKKNEKHDQNKETIISLL